MAVYIHQLKEWPDFQWKSDHLTNVLTGIHRRQGRLLGRMESLGVSLQQEANLEILTLDVLKTSEIEGEILSSDQVRSSIARKLGIDIAGLVRSERNVDGIVEMMLDATQNHLEPLTEERLFRWHDSLFPTRIGSLTNMAVGAWRTNSKDDPMQVVSGPLGRQTIHYQAPDADLLPDEMKAYINWFNGENMIDAIIKAALAHLYFITIHPFDDGNGRIARAMADMQLARADGSNQRFYSMSAQIRKERNAYYDILEQTQKESMDVTVWIEWFLGCLDRSITATEQTLAVVMKKAKFWDNHLTTALNKRQKTMLNKLLDGFKGKLTSSKWARITKTSTDTAVRDINDLLQKEVLIKEPAGGRSTSYALNLR